MSAGRLGVDLEACAGGSWVGAVLSCWGSGLSAMGGPLDAPVWIAAGYMSAASGEYLGEAVRREPRQFKGMKWRARRATIAAYAK